MEFGIFSMLMILVYYFSFSSFPGHGECHRGECQCHGGYASRHNCNCSIETDDCFSNDGGQMCSGRGNCICGNVSAQNLVPLEILVRNALPAQVSAALKGTALSVCCLT
uniref:Uncharacterized protein n=1 Tax=Sphaerodactylus townsendi TaxID=933632 RepID=A0ACB8G118_9SAUR